MKKIPGFTTQDRLLVIHADDVGFCQASLDACTELFQAGLVSCGSTMAPCPWFPAVADYCRNNPLVDMGVHVTLTCEWETYRWSPLTTRDPASGLLDEDGYCPSASHVIWERADAQAVLLEMQAQVDRARQAGIEITHIDDHMAAQAHPRLLPQFMQFCLAEKLPTGKRRPAPPSPQENEWQRATRQALLEAEARGMPLFDASYGVSHPDPQIQLEEVKAICRQLSPGSLAEIILHPAKDTPELRAIARDWPGRVANYQMFMDAGLRQYIQELGVQVIGFRALREAMIRSGSV